MQLPNITKTVFFTDTVPEHHQKHSCYWFHSRKWLKPFSPTQLLSKNKTIFTDTIPEQYLKQFSQVPFPNITKRNVCTVAIPDYRKKKKHSFVDTIPDMTKSAFTDTIPEHNQKQFAPILFPNIINENMSYVNKSLIKKVVFADTTP